MPTSSDDPTSAAESIPAPDVAVGAPPSEAGENAPAFAAGAEAADERQPGEGAPRRRRRRCRRKPQDPVVSQSPAPAEGSPAGPAPAVPSEAADATVPAGEAVAADAETPASPSRRRRRRRRKPHGSGPPSQTTSEVSVPDETAADAVAQPGLAGEGTSETGRWRLSLPPREPASPAPQEAQAAPEAQPRRGRHRRRPRDRTARSPAEAGSERPGGDRPRRDRAGADRQNREARPDGRQRRGSGEGRGRPRGQGRDGARKPPEQKLYSLEAVVDRGFEDVAEEGAEGGTRRVHWTILKRTVADQKSGKGMSAVYVLQRDGADSEFPNLAAARAAANKTIVHPEKLTVSKAEHAAARAANKK